MCWGLANFHTTRSNINIGNVGAGGRISEEDTVVGVLIKFSRTQSIASGRDKGTKSFKMGNVGLKRCLVDRRVPESILEMDGM